MPASSLPGERPKNVVLATRMSPLETCYLYIYQRFRGRQLAGSLASRLNLSADARSRVSQEGTRQRAPLRLAAWFRSFLDPSRPPRSEDGTETCLSTVPKLLWDGNPLAFSQLDVGIHPKTSTGRTSRSEQSDHQRQSDGRGNDARDAPAAYGFGR